MNTFVCALCGNVTELLNDSGARVVCCGEPMQVLAANTTDAAQEKHVPACTVSGQRVSVQVGSVAHPMQAEHHIGWIWLQTRLGGQRRVLAALDEPRAEFTLAPGDAPVAVYAWCNLHGLWRADTDI